MVELVQFACANSPQMARRFVTTNAQGLLEAAGQAEQQMCQWNEARAVWICYVSFAVQVMLRAARLKGANVAHTGAGVTASEVLWEPAPCAVGAECADKSFFTWPSTRHEVV
jgi:hypothetical protein